MIEAPSLPPSAQACWWPWSPRWRGGLAVAPIAPDRPVLELRPAQVGALVLASTSGVGAGLRCSSSHTRVPARDRGRLAFLVVAITATLREPHPCLLLLASAFAAHAAFDTLHQPGWLGDLLVPRWYALASAVMHLALGALCFLPLLRRK
jgi:hypothetical protein